MDDQQKRRINELTKRYVDETITAEEMAELNEWLDSNPLNRARFNERIKPETVWKALADLKAGELARERVREKMEPYFREETPSIGPQKKRWKWYTMGAASVLAITATLWILIQRPVPADTETTRQPVILAGGNKAILQLADGKQIDLSGAAKGKLAQQGNSQVIKQDSGQLSYLQVKGMSNAAVTYNMVLTPKGGTYQVILPDNTLVYLNAESSIRFPTAFTGTERQVELTGEAYFEVSKNKAMPFVVKAKQFDVRVLGTHFDVRSYADEQVAKATLLEGSIALQAASDFKLLKPGEQALIGNGINISNIDTDDAIAWKEGYFVFNHADIETIMREISRWFNVKVVYKGEKTDKKLTGKVSRMTDASSILQILEANGYHINISEDAKTITILP